MTKAGPPSLKANTPSHSRPLYMHHALFIPYIGEYIVEPQRYERLFDRKDLASCTSLDGDANVEARSLSRRLPVLGAERVVWARSR